MPAQGICKSCGQTTFREKLCEECAGKPCPLCGSLPHEIKQIDIGVAGYPVYCFGKAHVPYRKIAHHVSTAE